jgi:elongation factor Ts
MANITAAAVKSLRDRTGLPMMDCKKALQEVDGDEDVAVEMLRKAGKQTMDKRAGRETSTGRVAIYSDMEADDRATLRVGSGRQQRGIRCSG